ncbi:hypothetical protein KAM576c_24000 [Enterobacter asburiae]|nr:hypothetical protein KAM576c_24000 [Enterobacter asburiae]
MGFIIADSIAQEGCAAGPHSAEAFTYRERGATKSRKKLLGRREAYQVSYLYHC